MPEKSLLAAYITPSSSQFWPRWNFKCLRYSTVLFSLLRDYDILFLFFPVDFKEYHSFFYGN